MAWGQGCDVSSGWGLVRRRLADRVSSGRNKLDGASSGKGRKVCWRLEGLSLVARLEWASHQKKIMPTPSEARIAAGLPCPAAASPASVSARAEANPHSGHAWLVGQRILRTSGSRSLLISWLPPRCFGFCHCRQASRVAASGDPRSLHPGGSPAACTSVPGLSAGNYSRQGLRAPVLASPSPHWTRPEPPTPDTPAVPTNGRTAGCQFRGAGAVLMEWLLGKNLDHPKTPRAAACRSGSAPRQMSCLADLEPAQLWGCLADPPRRELFKPLAC